jgi:Lon protease-like protein
MLSAVLVTTSARITRIAVAFALVAGLAGVTHARQAPPAVPAPPAAVDLPATIPLFPLPDVVMFPDVSLPLRIFEPRYRALMADALKGNRLIGMVLLQPGHEAEYEGRPPIFSVGCAGIITQDQQLPNGEYTFVLRGLQKFRVTGENPGGAYRVANITPLPEATMNASQADAIRTERQRIDTLLAPVIDQLGINPPPPGLSDAGLVVGLAQLLDLSVAEWQDLLELDGVLARLRWLADRLEGLGVPGGNLAYTGPSFTPFVHPAAVDLSRGPWGARFTFGL